MQARRLSRKSIVPKRREDAGSGCMTDTNSSQRHHAVRLGFGQDVDPAEDAADEKQLSTVITNARTIGYGKWRFTVEGGAVWETVEANMRFNDPAPGRKVLIERGSLGAYFVTVEKGGRVQAKRVG